MASTIFLTSFTLPKTTCLPFNHLVLAVQMKNCKPFVLAPVFAMDKRPGPVYFRMKFLSSNFSPEMDLPPVPLWHVQSPPWHINPRIILLKQDLSFPPSAQIMKVFHCLGTLSVNSSKETWSKDSLLSAVLKNTVGLTIAGKYRRLWGGDICKACCILLTKESLDSGGGVVVVVRGEIVHTYREGTLFGE